MGLQRMILLLLAVPKSSSKADHRRPELQSCARSKHQQLTRCYGGYFVHSTVA